MHNSLYIRDLLRKTNQDPLRLERRDPHRHVAADPLAQPGPGEFALAGDWQVVCRAGPEVTAPVEEDLRDLLRRLGVTVAPGARQVIELTLDPDLPERACRLDCRPGHIHVAGGGAGGLWAGMAWLEWEMRTRRGPILAEGRWERQAAWQVQISQGPWGGNYSVPDFGPDYLGDDAFRLYAHYGVNSMMIYGDLLCYVQSQVFPELSCADYAANIATLQEAARRAARYGVQLSYVVVGPKLRPDHPLFQRYPRARGAGLDRGHGAVHCLCSTDAAVHAFYDETVFALFSAVPELAGLICIVGGESLYHCRIWPGAQHPCPVCSARDTEDVIAGLLETLQSAARRAQPRAWVAAWPYTTWGWERPDRAELVRRLPAGVAYFQHIEKDQQLQKAGYTKHIWDYSVDYAGPSDNLRSLAPLVHAAGRPLFVKTETGIGLEVFQFPYVPAMQRLADKWQAVRDLAPYGVHQSWLFFGMCGSRAEELGLWAAYRPDLPRDEFLRRVAARDFGPGTVEAVLAAWAHMSRAMGHLPCITFRGYYIGPSFLGPAHPLVPRRGQALPDVFYGTLFYLQEGEETFSRRQVDEVRTCLAIDDLPETAAGLRLSWEGPGDGWDIVVNEYAAAAGEARAAWELLQQAAPHTRTPADAANLREETLLAELVYRTLAACEHTARFLLARRRLEATGDPAAHAEMRRLAQLERANALAAAPIYREARWLDLCERTDGRFASCVAMIEAKVQLLDAFLEG